MKKVFLLLMLVLLTGNVFAMTDPIRVKTDIGYKVKLYAWTAGTGPLLTNAEGVVDENGTWETTFFSLNVPTAKFHVIVLNENEGKIYDEKFDNWGIDKPLEIECLSGDCSISVISEEVPAVEEVAVVAEALDVNAIESEEVVLENETGPKRSLFSGNAVFGEGGFIKWLYSIGGILVVFILGFFIFMFFKKGTMSVEDRELARLEKEVKRKADEIKKIKDAKDKRRKIYEAKARLTEESKELNHLKSEKLRVARSKLENENKRLSELKGYNSKAR